MLCILFDDDDDDGDTMMMMISIMAMLPMIVTRRDWKLQWNLERIIINKEFCQHVDNTHDIITVLICW